jgi:hypothetical protein
MPGGNLPCSATCKQGNRSLAIPHISVTDISSIDWHALHKVSLRHMPAQSQGNKAQSLERASLYCSSRLILLAAALVIPKLAVHGQPRKNAGNEGRCTHPACSTMVAPLHLPSLDDACTQAGFRGVIFDKDNTLTRPFEMQAGDQATRCFSEGFHVYWTIDPQLRCALLQLISGTVQHSAMFQAPAED